MDKMTKIIANEISKSLLGDLDLDLDGGVIRGTSLSEIKGKYEMQLGFFPLDDVGDPEENPVATWKIVLDRTS